MVLEQTENNILLLKNRYNYNIISSKKGVRCMLRTAGLQEAEEIYKLNTELFVVLNNLRGDIYNPIAFPMIFIKSMINSLNSDYIIVEDDDKIVGYALIEERVSPYKEYEGFIEDHYAFIYELVVLPEYRTKGYGKTLIEEAINWAKKRNLDSIELNVLSNNYNARAFYDRIGFEEYQIKLRRKI